MKNSSQNKKTISREVETKINESPKEEPVTQNNIKTSNKKSKAPLIIGITCGVILLCGIIVLGILVVLPILGFNKFKTDYGDRIDEVKKIIDEKKDEIMDQLDPNDSSNEISFYEGQKDPRILITSGDGWIIVKDNGSIVKEVKNPEIAQADHGSFLFSFYSGKWMPNYSDILVVRSGAWDEEFDWYLSVVDEEGKQMKNICGINGDEMPVDPTFTLDGNISFLVGSRIEDPNAWGGVVHGGKIIVINLKGEVVKEYNHTNRLFTGKSGFYWTNENRGVVVGSYPLEGHAAWYDGVVLADPELQDSSTEVLINTYTDYGEPHLLSMSKNKEKLAIIATDKVTYSLNVFTYDMQNKSLRQLTNYDPSSGVYLSKVGVSSDGSTLYYVTSNNTDYTYTLFAINMDGSQQWKVENIAMPMSIDN